MHHLDAPVTMLETSALQGQIDEVTINAFFTDCIQRRYFPGDDPSIGLNQQVNQAMAIRSMEHA